MTDTGRTIYSGGAPIIPIEGWQSAFGYVSSTGDLPMTNPLVPYTLIDLDATPQDDSYNAPWVTFDDGDYIVTERGLYRIGGSATFTGPGNHYERWVSINDESTSFQRPGGNPRVVDTLYVDDAMTPATFSFAFGSANSADSVTYAEFYIYKVA